MRIFSLKKKTIFENWRERKKSAIFILNSRKIAFSFSQLNNKTVVLEWLVRVCGLSQQKTACIVAHKYFNQIFAWFTHIFPDLKRQSLQLYTTFDNINLSDTYNITFTSSIWVQMDGLAVKYNNNVYYLCMQNSLGATILKGTCFSCAHTHKISSHILCTLGYWHLRPGLFKWIKINLICHKINEQKFFKSVRPYSTFGAFARVYY